MKKFCLNPIRSISFWLLMVTYPLYSQHEVDFKNDKIYHTVCYDSYDVIKKQTSQPSTTYEKIGLFYNSVVNFENKILFQSLLGHFNIGIKAPMLTSFSLTHYETFAFNSILEKCLSWEIDFVSKNNERRLNLKYLINHDGTKRSRQNVENYFLQEKQYKYASIISLDNLSWIGLLLLLIIICLSMYKLYFNMSFKVQNKQANEKNQNKIKNTTLLNRFVRIYDLNGLGTNRGMIPSATIHPLEPHLTNTQTLDTVHKILDEDDKVVVKNTYVAPSTLVDVHPELFGKLHSVASCKLTNLDLKYAAYIYMNMDNNEIASALNVTTKTVRMTKYRLKQKLCLSRDEDLKSYLQQLPMN